MKTGTITADGATKVLSQSASAGHGNFSTLYIKGTWGGGTITVAATPDNGDNTFDIIGGSMTADGYLNIAIKTTALVLTLSGATDPNLTYWVV